MIQIYSNDHRIKAAFFYQVKLDFCLISEFW